MTSFLYDRVVSVISKPPDRREEREIIDLMPWFQKKSEIFRSVEKGETINSNRRHLLFLLLQRFGVCSGIFGPIFFLQKIGPNCLLVAIVTKNLFSSAKSASRKNKFS